MIVLICVKVMRKVSFYGCKWLKNMLLVLFFVFFFFFLHGALIKSKANGFLLWKNVRMSKAVSVFGYMTFCFAKCNTLLIYGTLRFVGVGE